MVFSLIRSRISHPVKPATHLTRDPNPYRIRRIDERPAAYPRVLWNAQRRSGVGLA